MFSEVHYWVPCYASVSLLNWMFGIWTRFGKEVVDNGCQTTTSFIPSLCFWLGNSTASPARSHCADTQRASAQSVLSDSNRCKTWSTAMRVTSLPNTVIYGLILIPFYFVLPCWTYPSFSRVQGILWSPDHRKENKDTLKSNEELFVQVRTSYEFGFVVSLLCQYILVSTSI